MAFLPSIVALPKDTTHSCVFDFPDRPVRPTPPVGPPPLYPYDPVDDWSPSNPSDNGTPGSANPPSTLNTAALKLYWSLPNIGFAYNAGIRNYKGDGVSLGFDASDAINSFAYFDPFSFAGGDPSTSAIMAGIKTGGDFHGVINFAKMVANHPAVLVFTGDVSPNTGNFLGSGNFTLTLKDYRGIIPPASIGEINVNKDFSFTSFTGPTSWTFPITVPSVATALTAFFHFNFVVATNTLTLTYPSV